MAGVHHKQILIVEDDWDQARVLQLELEAVGYATMTLGNGNAALSYAAEHQPDLVILDVRLPDIGGYEVCKQLRKLFYRWDVPILMLTGMDKPMDQLRGFAHGADAYLTKPCEYTELLKTVALLLGETIPA